MPASTPWPTELRLSKDRRTLTISFDTGETFSLPAEYLRVVSPSAEVQGHSPAERKLQYGKRDVEILGLEPVGNYAIRISFDDMTLGREYDTRWAAYLAELEAAGRSR
jgi:DUF971 family protein